MLALSRQEARISQSADAGQFRLRQAEISTEAAR